MGPCFVSLDPVRRVTALEMTEAQLDHDVLALWRAYGWTLRLLTKKRGGAVVEEIVDPYHTRDSRGSAKGFPDRVAIRPPRLMFVELKKERGRIEPEQQAWHNALKLVSDQVDVMARLCGEWWPMHQPTSAGGFVAPSLEAYFWWPSDLLAGEIERTLR